MPRPQKSLLELVREGTFVARKHHELLAGADLQFRSLAKIQQRYREAGHELEQRRIAVEFQREIPRLHERQERTRKDLPQILDSLGPARSADRVVAFVPRFFRHYAGPRAGRPFRLEEFQERYVREFWRRDKHGRRVYRFGCFAVPKGNGKTPFAAVLGTNALMDPPVDDLPEVYGIAGDRKQAGFAQKFVKHSLAGELGNWLKQSGNVVRCPSNGGEYSLLSSEGFNAHGINPSAGLVDEWWQFKHPHQREGVNAIDDALQKRGGESWLLAISQAYFDYDTMLAEFHQDALKHPKLRVERDGCLLVLEDEESGTLMHWYGAPDGADIEDPKIIRACNPLSLLRVDDILAPLKRPGASEAAWRRLHLNQPTRGLNPWLATGSWARLRADVQLPVGADLFCGIDAARQGDTTAVGQAWRLPDGRIGVRARVWSAIASNRAHEYPRTEGVLINEELVEPYVHELAKDHRVRGIVFDEQYFVTEAHHLGRAGFPIAPMYPWSKEFADAVVLFKKLVDEGKIAHDGDEVLAAHIGNCVAEPKLRGTAEIEKIGKPGRSFRIDAATATIMAVWLCVNSPAASFEGGVEFHRGDNDGEAEETAGFQGGAGR